MNYECGIEPKFKCQHCPFKARQKGNLKAHIIAKHWTKCFEQDSTYENSELLVSNPVIYRRRYDCSACGKSYKYKNGLNSHLKYECGQNPQFHCPYCPHSAHQKSNLKVHLVKRHNNILKKVLCFIAMRRLKRRVLEEHKTYRCSTCNKSYVYKAGLSRHQKYECGKEPQFQCPHCPYRAKIKSNLTAHVAYKHMNFH
ncbi:hypothetical protein O3M35_011201 [Rhynocoris fuscipes]|uniref:C2H2-type domain-containing protein n=1 Tax=Rhynocoris fuscipes TaxID=488301 RepID=A0AAW1D1G9_9HEMI